MDVPIGVRIILSQPTIGSYPWVGFRPPSFDLTLASWYVNVCDMQHRSAIAAFDCICLFCGTLLKYGKSIMLNLSVV